MLDKKTVGLDVNINYTISIPRIERRGIPTIFLHGTSANRRVWQPTMELLREICLSIALDQRGHGESDKPSSGYDALDFAKDVVNVLDAEKIERCLLVGHSLGARNAWVIGSHFPDRVAAVVAVDYVPYVESEVLDELRSRVAAGDREFESLEDIRFYLRGRYARMPEDAIERRVLFGYKQGESVWRPLAPWRVLNQVVESFRQKWEPEFLDTNVRLSCIRGELSSIVSDAAWEKAKELRQGARWHIAAGLDHYIPEEDPLMIVKEISAVFDDICLAG